MKENTVKICPICGCEYEGFGNNAAPIMNDRCCDLCNAKVIEMRLLLHQMTDMIDGMIKDINATTKGNLGFFTYRDVNYGIAIYFNPSKKLTVKLTSNNRSRYNLYSIKDIIQMSIQNYIDSNYSDKKLGKSRGITDFDAMTLLDDYFEMCLAQSVIEQPTDGTTVSNIEVVE